MIQLLFGRVRESEITRYIERKKKYKIAKSPLKFSANYKSIHRIYQTKRQTTSKVTVTVILQFTKAKVHLIDFLIHVITKGCVDFEFRR